MNNIIKKVSFAIALAAISAAACKPKEASLQTTRAASIEEKKYEWCMPSNQAFASIIGSIKELERNGKTSITHSDDGKKVIPSVAPKNALAMLEKPPAADVPSCGGNLDQALTTTSQFIAGALKGNMPAIALNATGGGCSVESSSGILAVSKLQNGGYMIELMGCGGRTRSEMMIPKDDLIKFARTILKGV